MTQAAATERRVSARSSTSFKNGGAPPRPGGLLDRVRRVIERLPKEFQVRRSVRLIIAVGEECATRYGQCRERTDIRSSGERRGSSLELAVHLARVFIPATKRCRRKTLALSQRHNTTSYNDHGGGWIKRAM